METSISSYNLTELTSYEAETINGGVVPIVAVGVAFAKGFTAGASGAATVHLIIQAIDKATS